MNRLDPPDIEDRCEEPRLRLADEDVRERRWTEFVRWCKGDRLKTDSEWATLLWHIERIMRGQADWPVYADINAEIIGFKETENWDGVLNALARAMREQRAES